MGVPPQQGFRALPSAPWYLNLGSSWRASNQSGLYGGFAFTRQQGAAERALVHRAGSFSRVPNQACVGPPSTGLQGAAERALVPEPGQLRGGGLGGLLQRGAARL